MRHCPPPTLAEHLNPSPYKLWDNPTSPWVTASPQSLYVWEVKAHDHHPQGCLEEPQLRGGGRNLREMFLG